MNWLAQRFELSRGGSAANVRPMEGMRGFAVFLVFMVHFVTLINPWIAGNTDFLVFATALHTIGNSGVDLFFVLSGYLIYGSLIARCQKFMRFMSRRVVRIYPAFIAVFLIYVALSLLFPAESKIPATAPEGIWYLIQNFLLLPGLLPIEPMITVAWSLSYEMFYYLLIPLVIAVFRLRDRSAVWRTTFFLGAATVTAIYCAINGGHVRLIMFISGIVLYEVMNSPRPLTLHSFFGLLALCTGLLGTLLPMTGSGGIALKVCILFVSFFALCLACFRDSSAWLPRLFSWTPLRWLGNMSYSYYLLHGLALKAEFQALSKVLPVADHGAWLFWALLPPMFALTLIPTSALFLLVERPYSLSPR
ncbi:MAG: acyltransferase [Gallionella sp.]|nr:acyltransferase [Gallionella sp.]MDD4945857.1 acyltransferase [Gallionella sp.]MDD5611870.1 acyltransferase [Gallionella sp.]